MIDVPYSVAKLYEEDSISKNFRVQFLSGEYPDLVNKDFVSESVIFTESVLSSPEFKLGLGDSGKIEFQTYSTIDMTNEEIFCCTEIDISSLSEELIEEYGQTSADVPYPFYRVPYGYFTVDTCVKSEKSGVYKVVAYNDKIDETHTTSKVFRVPTLISDLLKFGMETHKNPQKYTEYWSNGGRIVMDSDSILFSSLRNHSFIPNYSTKVWSYTEDSPVFTYQKSYFSDISDLSDNELRDFNNPCSDVMSKLIAVKDSSGTTLGTSELRMYLNARCIYIKPYTTDSTQDYTSPVFHRTFGGHFPNENRKYYSARLPYSIYDTSSGHIDDRSLGITHYKVTWKNNINLSSVIDSIYSNISERTHCTVEEIQYPNSSVDSLTIDDLTTFLSPCIRIMNVSTWPYNEEGHTLFPCECMCSTLERGASKNINYRTRVIHAPETQLSGNEYEFIVPVGIASYFGCPRRMNTDDDWSSSISGSSSHLEYNQDNSSVTAQNLVAICIPTSVSLLIPVGMHQVAPVVIPLNDLIEPEFSAWDYIIQWVFHGRMDSLVQFELSESKNTHSEGAIIEEYYDANGNIVELSHFYNRPKGSNIENLLSTRKFVSDWAELWGKFLTYDRLQPFTLKLKDFNAVPTVYPRDDLYPINNLYPGDTIIYSRSLWRKLQYDVSDKIDIGSVKCSDGYTSDDIIIDSGTHLKPINPRFIKFDSVQYLYGTATGVQYDMTSNYLVSYTYGMSNIVSQQRNDGYGYRYYYQITKLIEYIVSKRVVPVLKKVNYLKFSMTTRSLPYIEPLDMCTIITQDSAIITYNLNRRISGIQSLIDTIDTK